MAPGPWAIVRAVCVLLAGADLQLNLPVRNLFIASWPVLGPKQIKALSSNLFVANVHNAHNAKVNNVTMAN